MSIWEQIATELEFVEYINLNEVNNMTVNWNPEDVTIIQGPNKDGKGGKGGKGGSQPAPGSSKIEKVGEKPGEKKDDGSGNGENKPNENKPNENKPGENKPGEKKDGENKPGEKKDGESGDGESGKKLGEKPAEDDQTGNEKGGKDNLEDPNEKGKWKKGSGDKLDNSPPINTLDDHEIMRKKSDGSTLDDAFNKIHEKMTRRTGQKNPDGWEGSAGNMFRDDIKKVVRRRLPMNKIKNELKAFKEEISKALMADETYQLSILSGTSQGGESNINRPVEIEDDDHNKQSAILFMCVDTSGSMGDEEFELVYGWLREIADFFKSDSGGIPGKVYIIEYDTKVYAPIREWRNDKTPKAPRGGGGNAVNQVYEFLNKWFVKTVKNGNLATNTFVFKEKNAKLFDQEGKKDFYNIEHEIETTYIKNNDRTEQIKKLKNKQFKYGDMIKESYDYANVPFLLFFTDGYDEIPNKFGPLYRNNLGNILYIVTSKMWLGNIRPRNFIYCDLHVESFSDAFDTDGKLIDDGQGSRWMKTTLPDKKFIKTNKEEDLVGDI